MKAAVPRHNINALIKDYYQKTARLTLGNGTRSSTHKFSLGGWQGGSATPDIANIILEEVLRDTIKSWEDRQIGYHIAALNDDQKTFTYTESNHAVWADNVFLVAKNVDEAQTMLNEITTALLNANLQWKPKEAACMGLETWPTPKYS